MLHMSGLKNVQQPSYWWSLHPSTPHFLMLPDTNHARGHGRFRMAGEVDYMLHVAVADMAEFDTFYKRLIAAVPLRNVTSRFAMERLK